MDLRTLLKDLAYSFRPGVPSLTLHVCGYLGLFTGTSSRPVVIDNARALQLLAVMAY